MKRPQGLTRRISHGSNWPPKLMKWCFFAEAANRMKHLKAETVARVAITHMMHNFTSLFKQTITTEGVKHGPDLVVDMKELAEDAINCMDHLHFLEAMEEYHLSKPTASDTNKSQESESDYQPGLAEQSEDETNAESEEFDRPMRKRKAQTPTLASPPKIPAANPSPPTKSPGTSAPRSHKTVKKCPMPECVLQGHDLRRHLMVHVKREELAEEGVARLLSIARMGESQHGKERKRKGKQSIRGRPKKWCPVPLCNQIVVDVGQHLSYPGGHAIKRESHEFQRLMRMARPYTGLAEMEESLVPPPAKLVVVTPPNPTSPAASETYVSTAGRVASSVASDTAAPSSLVASSAAAAAAAAKPSAHASCSPVAAPAAASVASSDTAIRPVRHSKAPALLLESSEDEASDDEETSIPGSSVQYYTAKSPKSKRHRWLVLFFDYLSRPSAGDKKTSIRIQHVSQMRKILEAIDAEGDDITCLVQNEGDIVWSEWVKQHMEAGTKKPGTLISYLTSYEKFLSLVTHQRFNKSAPPLHPDYYDTLANVLKDLKGWRSVVDSKSYAVKNKRVVDETEGLLTLDELDSIKASSAYNQAVRLVLQAGNGRELSHK